VERRRRRSIPRTKAFSSEVDTGSREENASKQKKSPVPIQSERKRLETERERTMAGVYDFTAASLAGEEVPLKRFEGKVLLIVNTASACGFTPQYEGLETLHRELAPRGFSVLGFPCNQFGGQEPGDAKQIEQFCSSNYDVTFPMFAKIDVNGSHAHPLYNYLRAEKSGLLGSSIKWNFTKFLVDRFGKVMARHAPTARPEGLKKEIEALL
jgi:glutathione peroxidase